MPKKSQAEFDLELFNCARIRGAHKTMKEIKRRHRISDWYPDEVVEAGLYANMMGWDMHGYMNDYMDGMEDFICSKTGT